jgi:sugar phosphate isomerase/epimerase
MTTHTASTRSLSLGWLTLPSSSPLELIDAAGSAGIGSVGIRLAPPPGDPSPAIAANPALLREMAAALRHHGVALSEMGGIWLNGPRPSSWCRPALEAGARLGARHAIAVVAETQPNKALDDFCDLCDAAAEHGIGVAIEFVVYSAVKTVEDAAAFVRRSGRHNASVLVDALHLHRSGGSAASLASVPPELISIVQLCDGPARAPETVAGLQEEARRDRLDPGEGELPLRAFVEAFPPGTPLELEVPKLSAAGMPARQRIQELVARTREFLASIGST